MDELLSEEEQLKVKEKLSLIQRYEDGEVSLEEEILDILDEIYSFSKYFIPKIIITYSLIILYRKATSHLHYGYIEETSTLYKKCDEAFAYYKECAKILKEYLKIGFKTDEFPDLEAAYLLTIYTSGLLNNITDYLDEIITLESAYINSYNYSCRSNLYSKCEERMGKVKSLADAISPNYSHEQI